MKKIILVCLFFLYGYSLFALVFDNERPGIIAGAGAGISSYNFSQTSDNNTTDPQYGSGFVTDILLGYAPSKTFEFFINSHVSWFTMVNALSREVTVASSVSGPGLKYHLKQVENLFLRGTLGLASWNLPFEGDSEFWTGIGGSMGIGYEFIDHYSIMLSIKNGYPTGSGTETNYMSVDITLSALAY